MRDLDFAKRNDCVAIIHALSCLAGTNIVNREGELNKGPSIQAGHIKSRFRSQKAVSVPLFGATSGSPTYPIRHQFGL